MLKRQFKDFLRDRRGNMAILVAGGLMTLVGTAAIAVDVTHLYTIRNKLRITADTVVLAAAAKLPDFDAAQVVAIEYAHSNMDPGQHGEVVTADDVIVGTWDPDTKTFAAGGAAANAIQVSARRTKANGNPVNTFFASVFGYAEVDISVQAVAVHSGCSGSGYIAGEKVNMGQDIQVNAGVCIYGRQAVQAGQDPVVEPGAKVGALDINTITFGQDPSVPEGAIFQADMEPALANNISAILDDLENGLNLPPHIWQVQVLDDLPDTLYSGTAYVINNSISIDQDYTVTDVIIATRESISFGQDGTVQNTANACLGGEIAIGLYAVKNIAIGQDAAATGVQIVAGETVTIGQDLLAFDATVEAGKDIVIGQDPGLSGCQAAILAGGGASSRLVL